MNFKKTKLIAHASVIAALYMVLTYIAALFGLSGGAVQLRFSEALTVLPAFTPAAVPGLFVGCFLSNIFAGGSIWDIVFGSLATLLGAIGTYALRRHKYAAPIPPMITNTLIIPFVLRYAYGAPGSIKYFMLTVGIGEVVSCGLLGLPLVTALKKNGNAISRK